MSIENKAGPLSAYDLNKLLKNAIFCPDLDSRGDIIFFDGFEDGLGNWKIPPIGGTVALSADVKQSGSFSAKLTTDAGYPYAAYLDTCLFLPQSSKFGIEFGFTLNYFSTLGGGTKTGNTRRVRLQTNAYDGTTRYYSMVDCDFLYQKLQYMDSDGNYKDIATDLKLSCDLHLFHKMKVVFDRGNGKYVRCLLDNVEYDISTAKLRTSASTLQAELDISIIHYATDANLRVNYLDNIVVTQNEP